jgi:hypothetical protein
MFSFAANSSGLNDEASWDHLLRGLYTWTPAARRIRCTVIGRTFSAQ